VTSVEYEVRTVSLLRHKKRLIFGEKTSLDFAFRLENLLHKEVGWTSESVVRILHHRRWSACVWVAQIIGYVIRVKIAVHRMEWHVQAFRRTSATSTILTLHRHPGRRVPTVTHWTFMPRSTVTTVA